MGYHPTDKLGYIGVKSPIDHNLIRTSMGYPEIFHLSKSYKSPHLFPRVEPGIDP